MSKGKFRNSANKCKRVSHANVVRRHYTFSLELTYLFIETLVLNSCFVCVSRVSAAENLWW